MARRYACEDEVLSVSLDVANLEVLRDRKAGTPFAADGLKVVARYSKSAKPHAMIEDLRSGSLQRFDRKR